MEKEFAVLDAIATGKRIKELREERHIKIEDIREYMGFESQQAIYKWQSGVSLPTLENAFALARYFGVSLDDLLIVKHC